MCLANYSFARTEYGSYKSPDRSRALRRHLLEKAPALRCLLQALRHAEGQPDMVILVSSAADPVL